MIDLVRGFMEGGFGRGWPPQVIRTIPLPQLMVLFGEYAPDSGECLSADEQIALVNARRAAQGLPPIEKRAARTFAEAARQVRENHGGRESDAVP